MLGWYLLEPQAEMLGACKKKTLDRELLIRGPTPAVSKI